jgi:CBS domain-containing protein
VRRILLILSLEGYSEFITYKTRLLVRLVEASAMLKVEDVMVEEVITVEADATVMRAVKLMNKHEIGCLIVTKGMKPVGIVTERDLLKRVLAESRDPEKTRIWKVMSAPLVFVDPNMDVEDAVRFMLKMKIKKLPIVKKGGLLGLVTLTDLVRFQPQMVSILKKLSELKLPSPPRRLRKVIDYYVV